jgi:hypothetical protein
MVKKAFEEKQHLPFFVRSLTIENVDSIGFYKHFVARGTFASYMLIKSLLHPASRDEHLASACYQQKNLKRKPWPRPR